mgnify:CR=1 FL=1
MSLIQSRVTILAAAILIAPVYANSSSPKFHQGRLIVKLREGSSLPKSNLIKSSMHLFKNTYILRTTNVLGLEKELKVSNSVFSVNKDFYAKREELPMIIESDEIEKASSRNKFWGFGSPGPFNDPKVKRLWAFESSARKGMNVLAAYENYDSSNSEKVIVAVIDTGVDYEHEDLKDVMWTNPGEIAGNGVDDDGNGYIDDIRGINTLVRDADGNATMEIMDRDRHGTHAAGIIGAKQNNDKGIAGVASNVAIMGIRTVPNGTDESDVDVAEALVYAAKNGAKIINCSFGKSENENGMLVKETIDFIGSEYGVLVVASAGNSSKNIDKKKMYPASFRSENLLVVASNTNKGISRFSNYGVKSVDVLAPGSTIYSTVPGDRYASMSGTSMASPNAAGVAAEILSRNPGLSPIQLKRIIMSSVKKSSRFSKKALSGGVVDLKAALNL